MRNSCVTGERGEACESSEIVEVSDKCFAFLVSIRYERICLFRLGLENFSGYCASKL